jgi:hypothetical protein
LEHASRILGRKTIDAIKRAEIDDYKNARSREVSEQHKNRLSFATTESVNSRTGSRSEANGSEHLNHLCEQFVEPRFLGLIRLDYGAGLSASGYTSASCDQIE